MSELTKKRPTNEEEEISFKGPADKVEQARHYLKSLGLTETTKLVDASEVFPERHPGRMLRGARYREDMTQVQLAESTGLPRRHISEMENGKRPIGKANAKKLAEALNVDYRRFL